MIFQKKKDAIAKLNKSNNDNLRLFQRDNDITGSKKFLVKTQNEIYHNIKKNMSNNKNSYYYESWLENTNILFSLDIDTPVQNFDSLKFEKLIIQNINIVIKFAKEFYNHEYKINDVIVLKTEKQPNKFSSHIIFRGLLFENHKVCRNFFTRIVKKEKLNYCDSSIYGKTCLRTCYSSKKGKEYPLLPVKIKINNEFTCSVSDYQTELDFFVQTLITTVDEDELKSKMITEKMIVQEYDVPSLEVVPTNNNDNSSEYDLSEILSKLPEEYCNEYVKWNRVGMALFSISENNFDFFDAWSKTSSKYNKESVIRQWNGYKSSSFNKNVLGVGSLRYWAKEGGYDFPDKSIEHIVNSYPENKIEITENTKYDISYISNSKLNENVFLPNINKKILAVQSEKGTGKTSNLIKVLFEGSQKPPESVLFISSRRTFGIKLSADLKKYGFRLYSDIDEYYIYDKRVIVQVDSLLRLQRDNYDLIIIDECESLARYITSTHFTKNIKASTIVSNLEFRIFDCKNIIIMDADLSDRCLNYYTKLKDPNNEFSKNDTKVIVNKFTPFQDYKMKYMNYNIWLNEIKKKLMENKKIVIPMASNNKAKDLYIKLKSDFENKNIILIHKETNDEEKLSKLLKVNETWVNYDVVIYTPTVCMGVSFDPEHFDDIFAYGCHNSLGAQEFCQMLHRVRKPKNNTIYMSFDYYKYYDPLEDLVDYNQVEEMLCNDYYLTYHDIDSNLVKKKYKRDGPNRVLYYPYKEEAIYDLYVRNSTEIINNKLNFTACFFAYAKFKRYQIEFYENEDTEDLINELKQIKKDREEKEKQDEIENLLNAKTLTKEEYKEKCMRKDKFMSEEDVFEIKKYNLLKNYNLTQEELTSEVLEKYNNKLLMLNYNNLTSILKTEDQNTDKKLDILKNNQCVGEEYRNCYQDFTFKNRYTYHYYALRLLDYIGFDINDIDNKDNAILKDIIDENILGKINGKTLIEFLEDEKYGLYIKFDCRQLINREITNDFNYLLKVINTIINKQYGIKIKVLSKGKNKSYYLTTNETWEDLPTKIKSKNLIQKITKDMNYSEILDNLDQGLFINSDSESED